MLNVGFKSLSALTPTANRAISSPRSAMTQRSDTVSFCGDLILGNDLATFDAKVVLDLEKISPDLKKLANDKAILSIKINRDLDLLGDKTRFICVTVLTKNSGIVSGISYSKYGINPRLLHVTTLFGKENKFVIIVKKLVEKAKKENAINREDVIDRINK